MPLMPFVRATLALCLTLAVLAHTLPAPAADEKDTWDVAKFPTADGVKLVGRFYAPMGKDRKAVVVLLHRFTMKDGGNSKGNGWQDLAQMLQKDGYAVLSFDFRGHGDSTEVMPAVFWNKKQHVPGAGFLKKTAKKGDRISYTQFSPSYYPYLANDLAAARAYLEQRNDAKEVNCGNIILIGAGEGATVGSAWLYNESRRRKDKTGKLVRGDLLKGQPTGAEPEVRDVAAAVWLSLSPSLAGLTAGNERWLVEAGKYNKVPIGFINGNGALDNTSRTLSGKLLASIKQTGSKGPKEKDGKGISKEGDPLKYTLQVIKTANLRDEKLLDEESLKTLSGIRAHLNELMEDRPKEWIKRGDQKEVRTFYTVPRKDSILKVAKDFGTEGHECDIPLIKGAKE